MKLLIYHFNTLTSQSDFFFLVAILSVPLGSPRQTHATPPLPAACYWDGEETLREASHLGALVFSADLISGRHKGSLETVSSPPNTSQADKHFLKKRQMPSDPREDFPRERVGGWSKRRWQRRHRGACLPFPAHTGSTLTWLTDEHKTLQQSLPFHLLSPPVFTEQLLVVETECLMTKIASVKVLKFVDKT